MENSSKKISFVEHDVFAADLKDKFYQEYPILVKHKEIVTNQYAVTHRVKGNLNDETCVVQIYFAENVVSTHGEEMQSSYFYKTFVTLHPIMMHYKSNVQEDVYYTSPLWMIEHTMQA